MRGNKIIDGVAMVFDVKESASLENRELRLMRQRLFEPFSSLTPHFKEEGDGGIAVLTDQTVDSTLAHAAHITKEVNSIDDLTLRLRFAVDVGSFLCDQWGFTGRRAGHLFRMASAPELRTFHSKTQALGVVALSAVAHEQASHPHHYAHSHFRVKEAAGNMWLAILNTD